MKTITHRTVDLSSLIYALEFVSAILLRATSRTEFLIPGPFTFHHATLKSLNEHGGKLTDSYRDYDEIIAILLLYGMYLIAPLPSNISNSLST